MSEVKMGHLELANGIVSRIAKERIKNHKIRLDILRTKKSLATALEDFNTVKNELLREYGTPVGEQVKIDPEKDSFAEFTEKYDELAHSDTDGVNLIPLPTYVLDFLDLSVDDLEVLEFAGIIKLDDPTSEEKPEIKIEA